MKKVLHNFMEIRYDSYEELHEDMIKLKEQGFDIVDGYKTYDGKWLLTIVHTEKESTMRVLSCYGEHTKYEIRDKQNIIYSGIN